MPRINNNFKKEFNGSLGIKYSWKVIFISIRRNITESEEWSIKTEFIRITRWIFPKLYKYKVLMARQYALPRHRTTIETNLIMLINVVNRT